MSENIMQLQNRYVLGTYSPELLLVKGEMSWVWDAGGKRYLDFGSGISVCNLGHCHPKVTEAIREQAGKLVHVSNLYYNENQPVLASLIAQNSFEGRVFFCNSGAEANEGLIKFARRWGHAEERYEIICMDDSFHGRTLATLAATGRKKYRAGFQPDTPGFVSVPFNDIQAVEEAVGPHTVAVLVEAVQGEGGILPADYDFMRALRELTRERNLLLLLDEVQCGMGRTGRFFAYQHYGIAPDGMSMAKALANGLPMGAFEVQNKYSDVLPPGTHATTFGGTPLACAAAIAVMRTIEEEKILDNCRKQGRHLTDALTSLQDKYPSIREVRGKGLMIGMVMDTDASEVRAKCAQNGLLVLTAGENVLRMLPPLTVTKKQIYHAIDILDGILADISAE